MSGPSASDDAERRRAAATRIARGTVVGLMLVVLALAASLRPDYLDPTQLGTDVSTYLAAGQRVVGGGDLYHLAPGDRPVPIWPPHWTAPLVSPPSLALPWAALAAVLPPLLAMVAWWLGALVATTALAIWIVARGPIAGLILVVPLLLAVAVMAWTGNVNGYLLALTAATWILGTRPGRAAAIGAGAVVAMAAGLKVGPILLLAWLVGQRRWWSVIAALIVGGAYLALTALVVGIDAFGDYRAIARDATAASGPGYGVGAVAVALGMSEESASVLPWVVAAACAVGAIALRQRPRWAFAIAATGAVLGLPIARYESLALLLAALVPWTAPIGSARSLPAHPRRILASGVAVVVVVAIAGVAVATSRVSSLEIYNRMDVAVVVRVYYHGIPESFGFAVEPGQAAPAWGPLVGAAEGPLVVFGPGCERLSTSGISGIGGLLDIGPDGAATLGPAAAQGEGTWLPFDDACADRPPRGP